MSLFRLLFLTAYVKRRDEVVSTPHVLGVHQRVDYRVSVVPRELLYQVALAYHLVIIPHLPLFSRHLVQHYRILVQVPDFLVALEHMDLLHAHGAPNQTSLLKLAQVRRRLNSNEILVLLLPVGFAHLWGKLGAKALL